MTGRSGGTLRYVLTRIIIGLAIAIGMFYFRQAHAQGAAFEYYGQAAQGSFGAGVTFPNIYVPRPITTPEQAANAWLQWQRVQNGRTYLTSCEAPASFGAAINGRVDATCNDSRPGTAPWVVEISYERRCLNAAGETVNDTLCAIPPSCDSWQQGQPPNRTGTLFAEANQVTPCNGTCALAPFLGDDGRSVSINIGGNGSTVFGSNGTRWKQTGAKCDATAAPALANEEEKCKTVQGNNVCTGGLTIPSNCIRVNGQLSCTNSSGAVCTTPECQALAAAVKHPDGSATAARNAPTPPAPNNGTPGVKAPPTLNYNQIMRAGPNSGGGSTSNQFSYFNQVVVNGSYAGDGSVGNKPDEDEEPDEPPPDDPDQPCEGDGCEEGDGTFSPPAGEYGFENNAEEIDAKRAELETTVADIRTEAQGMFGTIAGGVGSLPSYNIQTICCGVLHVDMNQHASKIEWLGLVLIFITLVLAAFIILGAD